jgi:hypothetical protein
MNAQSQFHKLGPHCRFGAAQLPCDAPNGHALFQHRGEQLYIALAPGLHQERSHFLSLISVTVEKPAEGDSVP